ncbi:MAG: hypothetical protein WDM94_04055 [Bauldia sp.]
MTTRTKLSLAAAAVAVVGVAAAPALATAMADQFASAKIFVMAPSSANGLGTIWFDVTDTKAPGVSFGGPR